MVFDSVTTEDVAHTSPLTPLSAESHPPSPATDVAGACPVHYLTGGMNCGSGGGESCARHLTP